MTQKDADYYEKEAARSLENREESFQRSDTDGFLSQWAEGLNANLNKIRAEITRNGKKAEFRGLYFGNERIAAKQIETQLGFSWLLSDDAAKRFGRRFVPCGGKSRIQKQLGLREAKEIAPAWACLSGEGRGLSGQVWVVEFRTGDKYGLDAELLEKI